MKKKQNSKTEILIAEDSATQSVQLQHLLEELDYAVTTAANGKKSLDEVKRRKPALIISDIEMPLMDGYALCQAVKQDADLRDIPVILLSVLSESEDIIRAIDVGADGYLTKPCDQRVLHGRIQSLLASKASDAKKNDQKCRRICDRRAEEVNYKGKRYQIKASRQQILNILLSVYENILIHNHELDQIKSELQLLNGQLEQKVQDRTASLNAEITVRKEQEQKIMRLNRVYSVLSDINSTIVRTHSRQELFDATCRIAVESGQFRMAWIGLFDANGMDITPVAKGGVVEGYLDKIDLTAREGAADACILLVQALQEKTAVVCNDIASDPRMARWREEALRRGYRSVVVFPLQLGDKVTGLFLLYAAEADFFDTAEMKLLIEVAGDISFALDHLEKEERLNYLAYYDVLTGLPNRSLFYDRLNQHIRTLGADGAYVAVLVIDLERFRNINETLGRHAADTLLKQVARRLEETRLDSDHLARIGADCFAAMLPDFNDESDIARFLEQDIMGSLNLPFMVGANEWLISAKIGIAVFPADGANADVLLRNAEAALEKAKLSGDKYMFYVPELNARVAEKLALENKLRHAVELEQFVLYYQPKVSLKNGQIIGLEALIRWNDLNTGLVPPAKFIPLLEETGMILDVGQWALRQAVADIRQWRANGLTAPRVAVNVSPIQLQRKDFVDTVQVALGTDAAQYLDLEITESLIMQNVEANIVKLNAIRAMGVQVAIDDFGTGYSSLSYIARLPVTLIKIDRTFIINMTTSPNDLSIVSAIITLAHSLDMKVIAEGVETQDQANLLRLLKCDEIQGYLFSQAVPAENIGLFLKEGKSLPI